MSRSTNRVFKPVQFKPLFTKYNLCTMSRSSARLASKQPTKGDSDFLESPTVNKSPTTTPKKVAVRHEEEVATPSRLPRFMTSESSADEYHSMEDEDDDHGIVLPTPSKRPPPISKSPAKRNLGCTEIVDSARSKFDTVLAHISRGDVEEFDEDEDSEGVMSPPSKSQRKNRPKKQKKSNEDGHTKTTTMTLRLFDRAVDLAKFCNTGRSDVALYPVCREWIRNQRAPEDFYMLPCETKPEEKVVGALHRLPEPLPIPQEYLEKNLSPRIPLTIGKPEPNSEVIDAAINTCLDKEQLLADNLKKWKHTRNEWRASGKRNELRYKHSCDVLKSMYEKSTQVQPLLEPKLEPLDD